MRQLHVEYSDLVNKVCASFDIPKEDQEDAAQEILIKLASNEVSPTENEGGYVYTLIMNVLRDALRKVKRRAEIEVVGVSWDSVDEDDPLTILEREEEDEQAEVLVSDLAPDLRATAELYYFKGMDYKTIAEELSIPEGTVASRLNTARRLLRGE